MSSQAASFFRLDSRTGWRTDAALSRDVIATDGGLRLAARPGGPFSLAAADDSLGGLTLPRGLALDEQGIVTLLAFDTASVKRYDPLTQRFKPLRLEPWEGFGAEANLVVVVSALYLADPDSRRVQVFDLTAQRRVAVWGPFDGDGHPTPADAPTAWQPQDIASHDGVVYILDRAYARILRYAPDAQRLDVVVEAAEARGRWSRLALDQAGRFYVRVDEAAALAVFDSAGRPEGAVVDAGHPVPPTAPRQPPAQRIDEVRQRFAAPSIRILDIAGQDLFVLPPSLIQPCAPPPLRSAEPPPDLTPYPMLQAGGRLFDRDGEPASLDPTASPGPSPYVTCGTWVSEPLDSRIYHCQWHRVQLDVGDLPPGVHIEVRTFVADSLDAPALTPSASLCPDDTPPAGTSLLASEREVMPLARRAGSPPRRLEPLHPLSPWRREVRPPRPDGGRAMPRALAGPDDGRGVAQMLAVEEAVAPPLTPLLRDLTFVVQTAVPRALTTRRAGDGAPPPLTQLRAARVRPGAPVTAGTSEFLVQSQPGQYLRLEITLFGDGDRTPVVRGARVHYPRESYLTYLPAVFSADEGTRDFLDRFLSVFQTEWDDLERRVAESARLFDPAAVPAEALPYLADWLALPLEQRWDTAQQRRLAVAAPTIYPQRGTVQGLEGYVRVYLRNLARLDDQDRMEYPRLVEGFREREYLTLGVGEAPDLGYGVSLWSRDIVPRLQIGAYAALGQVQLVSTGNPQYDVFHEFAYRYRLFAPAAWVRTAEDESVLRRALDAETPAGVRYDLCLVEPRFRVGVQSTVGLDTVIGGYPGLRLASADDPPPAPSRPPRGRLGYDTLLVGDGA